MSEKIENRPQNLSPAPEQAKTGPDTGQNPSKSFEISEIAGPGDPTTSIQHLLLFPPQIYTKSY